MPYNSVTVLLAGLGLAEGLREISGFAGPVLAQPSGRSCPGAGVCHTPGRGASVVVASSAAGGALGGFEEEGWGKDWQKRFGPGPQPPKYKQGGVKLPSVFDFLPKLKPVSIRHKLVNSILRKKPVYSELYHEDYIDACRSIGVREDIDEPALQERVKQLVEKYSKDRKRRIMIEWAHDKITEHRLFMQLDGQTEKVPGVDPRMLDENFMELTELDELDLIKAVGLTAADLQAPPSKFAFLTNNPVARLFKLKRIMNTINYLIFAFNESVGGPNIRRLIWPGIIPLILAAYIGNAIDIAALQYLAIVILHAGPIYNRGEAMLKNRKEQRPIKWKKLGLGLTFTSITAASSVALGRAWMALKYPTFDFAPQQFLAILTNLLTYISASCFFIRDSTLEAGSSGKRR